MYLNIQGLRSHKAQLTWMANQNEPIIICLSETHVTEDFTKLEIDITGYIAACTFSASSHTGGTIIYVKEGYRFHEILKCEHNKNFWITGIEVVISKQKYYIYNLYHSPNASDAEFLAELDGFFENINLNAIFIMLGDFNIDLNMDSFYSNRLTSLINKFGLYQLVDQCTRITQNSSTKIDLLLTNKKEIKHEVHLTP